MKVLHSKTGIFGLLIMILLCVLAIGISVKVSLTIMERKNQIIRKVPVEEEPAVQTDIRPVNVGKLSEQILYFNGVKCDDIEAFETEQQDYLLSLDRILGKLGIDFKYYGPDDIFEAEISGQRVWLKLGETKATIGSKEVELPVSPVAAKDGILVPVELFSFLGNFSAHGYSEGKTSFLNYYPDYMDSDNSRIRIVSTMQDTFKVTDIGGKKLYSQEPGDSKSIPEFQVSEDKKRYTARVNDRLYLIDPLSGTLIQLPDVNPRAVLSRDGRYLYWIDNAEKTSYAYGIDSGEITETDDYYLKANTGDKNSTAAIWNKLLDFYEDADFRRITLGNAANGSSYTFIERNGNVLIDGSMTYSPDRGKVLFYRKNRGYYTANADGTNMLFVGDGTDAKWVDSDKVFFVSGSDKFLYSIKEDKKVKVNNEWKMLGQAKDNTVFFSVDSSLYYETPDGTETRLMTLPWTADYACGLAENGPYIVVSQKNNGVFLLNGNETVMLGRYSSLLNKPNKGKSAIDYARSIKFSEDRQNAAVLLKENGLLSVNVISAGSSKVKKVILNCLTGDGPYFGEVDLKWISPDRIVVYTETKVWVINLKGSMNVYERDELPGTSIEALLLS